MTERSEIIAAMIAMVALKLGCSESYARRAILATLGEIGEPSEAMIEAGWIDKEDVNPDDIWFAMIDALRAEIERGP